MSKTMGAIINPPNEMLLFFLAEFKRINSVFTEMRKSYSAG